MIPHFYVFDRGRYCPAAFAVTGHPLDRMPFGFPGEREKGSLSLDWGSIRMTTDYEAHILAVAKSECENNSKGFLYGLMQP